MINLNISHFSKETKGLTSSSSSTFPTHFHFYILHIFIFIEIREVQSFAWLFITLL